MGGKKRYPIIVSSLLVGLAAAAFMALYETTKALLLPDIAIWESHAITIAVSTAIAVLAASAILARHRDYESKLERDNEEKKMLLKELHHRVKNNYQLIGSILSLELSSQEDEGVRTPLIEAQNRIQAIASVHEMLYGGKSFSSVDAANYFRDLAALIVGNFGAAAGGVELETKAESVELPTETAIACGLAASELISNSIKHAFAGSPRPPKIALRFARTEGESARLEIADNGTGCEGKHLEGTRSMGVQLVRLLAEQLGGTASWVTREGTVARIEFPLRLPSEGLSKVV